MQFASFDHFWKKVTASAKGLDNKPALPHRSKTPHCFDYGSMPTFHVAVDDCYRLIYFEVPDLNTSLH